MKTICLYFQVHQPYRLKKYKFFDIGEDHNYYDDYLNRMITQRVSEKSYLPTNNLLLKLINKYKNKVKLSFSLSGSLLEQLQEYSPKALKSFQELVSTKQVELLGETYSHSLSSLKSENEFTKQIKEHSNIIEKLFSQKPTTFRNTELIYSDDIASIAYKCGYKAILSEGAKHVLGWKSPNFLYNHAEHKDMKVFLRNFNLSDDIAFRFSNRSWSEWPLTAEKFTNWIKDLDDSHEIVNIFMDYETFGEHQWKETGIFNFLESFINLVTKDKQLKFDTPSNIIKTHKSIDSIHVPTPTSWADEEKDLTAWIGNALQNDAFEKLYSLEKEVYSSNDKQIIEDWKKLQNSDHFYYMCTKWFSDGEVHSYFTPFDSPYDAYINFMNVFSDFSIRVKEKVREKSNVETLIDDIEDKIEEQTSKAKKIIKEKIKEYNIDDIVELSNTKVKQLLRKIDAKSISHAMHEATDDFKEKVLKNLGKRASNKLDEFEKDIERIKSKDIPKYKKKIEEEMKKLFG